MGRDVAHLSPQDLSALDAFHSGGREATIELARRANLVPGVTVTAVEAQSGKRLSAISDRNGNYNLAGLEPGAYTLTAVLPGFETVTFTGVALAAQGQSRLDFTLRIAARRNGLMPLAPSGPRDRVVDIRADSMTA